MNLMDFSDLDTYLKAEGAEAMAYSAIMFIVLLGHHASFGDAQQHN